MVKALRYWSDCPGIDSRWCHWGFFPWYPRQNHVPWGRLSLWKWVPGISPGVKAAGAFDWRTTTLVVRNVKIIRGFNLPGIPWATSSYRGTPLLFTLYTGWNSGNARFSYKNNFVYFQHKKVLITQKSRYFNAFLKYVQTYVRKIMSVRWRLSCRTHIRSLFSKSCIARSNIFCGRAAISWRMESFSSSIVRGLFVYTLDYRSGSSKCFNPLEYSVSIWNCTSTLNIELSTEKTLDSNYGITVSKTTARRQTHDALRSNARWLLKLHCLSCPPAHAQRHQPHPCRVLAIWKTCVFSAPPCRIAINRSIEMKTV